VAQVLDYSAGFPGAQAIADAGYVGAMRYFGRPGNRKNATAGELLDFTAHKIGMGAIFEGTLTDWRAGFAGGVANGRAARNHATSVGFPESRPMYLAVDQDVVTAVEFDVMLDYLRGAGSVLGGAKLTGVYGEADVIDRARDAGVAAWFWQTAAWSRGRKTQAHLYQHVGAVVVGNISCDVNDVLAADWGQHNAGKGKLVATQEEITAIAKAAAAEVWEYMLEISPGDGKTYRNKAGIELLWTNWYANMIPNVIANQDAFAEALTTTEADIITAVRGQAQPDLEKLAQLMVPLLAPMIPAGATPEQVRVVMESVIREAFARGAGQGQGDAPQPS
jgi:hypothetical protein